MSEMMQLTSPEIQHLASETAKAAVREMLLTMGVNANDPEAILKMQQDFAYLRDVREAVGTIKARGWAVAMGIVVSGVAAAVWTMLRGH
jgi:hypothetical protein